MHLKHSILGIISLIIGLFTDFALFCVIVVGTLIGEAYVDELDESSPIFLVTGLFILGSLFMSVLGTILGIIGLLEPNRKRTFPILGILFSFLGGLFVMFLLVLGSLQP